MSDNPFFLRVAATADRFSMLPPGRVTVCLSGGADSVALLRVLLELRERYALTVAAVHVHHGIRGDEASRDERFCRALCERLGVPLTVRRADVPALARASGDSLELAARKARYAAFEALRAQCGGVFATAHTLNDNAETVVHAFLRSRAPSSLCGIPPVRGFFVRPLLERTRVEVEDYLASLGQPFVTDATNADERYTRNFIRHTLLPLMQRQNPALLHSLYELSNNVKDDNRLLDALAEREPDSDAPSLVRRRTARAYYGISAGRTLTSAQLNAIAEAARKPGSRRLSLPGGIEAHTDRGRVTLAPAGAQAAVAAPVKLCLGGFVDFGAHFRIGLFEAPPTRESDENVYNYSTCYSLAFDMINENILAARSRAAGDVIRLGGMTKSLKKEYINRKFPARLRPAIPVVCDADGVVAVPGVGVADRARPPQGARKACIVFEFRD